jgi:putative intracellular protease/amidase
VSSPPRKRIVGGVLFPGFELLDIFGPLELLGILQDRVEISMIGTTAGPVASAQGPAAVIERAFAQVDQVDVLLVPGGIGARAGVEDPLFLSHLSRLHHTAEYTASICTGSALLARAGLLDNRKATTNKLSFDFPAAQGARVDWQRRARWVEDGNIFTASGVSAGMDMALALIERIWDRPTAEYAALQAEYLWNQDPNHDPFATSAS